MRTISRKESSEGSKENKRERESENTRRSERRRATRRGNVRKGGNQTKRCRKGTGEYYSGTKDQTPPLPLQLPVQLGEFQRDSNFR